MFNNSSNTHGHNGKGKGKNMHRCVCSRHKFVDVYIVIEKCLIFICNMLNYWSSSYDYVFYIIHCISLYY